MLNVIGFIEIMLVLVMDENVSLIGNCVCVYVWFRSKVYDYCVV